MFKKALLLAALLWSPMAVHAQTVTPPPPLYTQTPAYSCLTLPVGGNFSCAVAYGAAVQATSVSGYAPFYVGLTQGTLAPTTTCVGATNCGYASTKAYLTTGNLTAQVPTPLSYYQGLASGTLSITVDGVVNTSSTINLSGATSFANIASIITAAFVSPNFTVVYDPVSTDFIFSSNTANHQASSMSFATGTLANGMFLDATTGNLAASGGFVGNNNTAVGVQDLQYLTVGYNNAVFGEGAGYSLTNGQDNTLVGYSAGSGLTSGVQNVFVGSQAGQSVTAGNGNVAIGYNLGLGSASANVVNVDNVYVNSSVAPVVASGFGTSPSIAHHAGSHVVVVTVGTGGTASTGVLTMPASPLGNGWACTVVDQTTQSAAVTLTKQTASTSTSVTWGNYTDLSVSGPWVAGDTLIGRCDAY